MHSIKAHQAAYDISGKLSALIQNVINNRDEWVSLYHRGDGKWIAVIVMNKLTNLGIWYALVYKPFTLIHWVSCAPCLLLCDIHFHSFFSVNNDGRLIVVRLQSTQVRDKEFHNDTNKI